MFQYFHFQSRKHIVHVLIVTTDITFETNMLIPLSVVLIWNNWNHSSQYTEVVLWLRWSLNEVILYTHLQYSCIRWLVRTVLYENIDQILPNELHGQMHYHIGVTCVSNGHMFYTLYDNDNLIHLFHKFV